MKNKAIKLITIGLCFILLSSLVGCTVEVDNLNKQIKNNLDRVKDIVNDITEMGEGLAVGEQFDRIESFSEVYKENVETLSIDNKVGAIRIYKGSSSELVVKYDKKVKNRSASEAEINKAMNSINVELQQKGKRLDIVVNMTKDIENLFRNRTVEFEIFIPEAVKDIYVENSVGSVELDGINVEYIKSNVSVGELKLNSSVAKDTSLNTSTGSIKINNSQLNGRITTSTGSIDIEGGKLNGDTTLQSSTGSIYVAAELAAGKSFDFASKTGSIRILLKGDYSFKLDAQTSIGDIETNLDLKDIYSKKGVLTGISGDGSGRLNLKTEVGSIKVNK